MKKILLLASIFCLCLGAVACSKSSDNSTTNTDEDVNVSTDATTDANADSDTDVTTDANADSDTDVTTESSSEEETTSVDDIVAKEEIINAEWHSGLVQINDKIIQLPVSLSDLVALGLDYEIWVSKRRQEEKSYLIAPDEEVRLRVVLNGEKISELMFKNETSDFKMMEEFNPSIYEIDVYEKPANAAMFFPGGLTFGDSYKSVQEKLGKALEVTKDMTYVYGKVNGTNLGMEVRVDKNAQSICGFRMIKFDVEINNDTTLTSTILDEVSTLSNSHVHKIALSWMKEYTVAASDPYKPEYERNASRAIDSIFISDGALHKMGLSFLMRPESDCSYILQRYGEPIFTETDGNGITRNIYASEGNFVVVCISKDCFLDGFISFEKLSGSTEMSDDTKQNLAIEIARSIKFESTN